MRKFSAVVCLLAAVALSGCAADMSGGITEQPAFTQRTAEASPQEPETSAETSAPEEAAMLSGAPEPVTVESAAVNPVSVLEGLGNEYLGLPDTGRVYIFRDTGERSDIDGDECLCASCYDEDEGTLSFICAFWVSADGSRVYRQGNFGYALLPEDRSLSGFTPEQSPEDVMAQANDIYCAACGLSKFDGNAQPLTSDRGTFYPMTDERLNTRIKLNAALGMYFTGELLETLLSGSDNLMEDDSGRLYCLEFFGGISYIGTDYSLAELTEDAAVYKAVSKFEHEEGKVSEREYTLTAVKTPSGWRFSEYQLPYGE